MIELAGVRNLLAYSTQIALVTAAGGVAAWMLRIDVATLRYGYWRALLALCLVLPLVQPWTPIDTLAGTRPAIVDGALPSIGTTLGVSRSVAHTSIGGASSAFWPGALGILLMSGVAARGVWLAAGLWRLRKLRRCGSRMSDPEIEELARLVGVNPEVRLVPNRGQPATFGFLRPVVLLPTFVQMLDPAVRRAVVAHELWHVRRRDWVFIVFEEIVCAALWFHPAIWWVVARVRNAREEAIDELTVLLTGARRPYVEALLTFADEPPLLAAAAFARRRHLFDRMVLISKEAVMSSERVVASCAAVAALVLCSGWFAVHAFPLEGRHPVLRATGQQPPPPPPPAPPRDRPLTATSQGRSEAELKKLIAANPQNVGAQLELAQLQESRGASQDAEMTLITLRANVPNDNTVLNSLAQFYTRTGQFDRAIDTLNDIVLLDPSDPLRHHLIATYYWEKVTRDTALSPSVKREYLEAGMAAADRAISLNANYVEALVYKNLLLRTLAEMTTDTAAKARLITEADSLRSRAMELWRSQPPSSRRGTTSDMPMPPPPPPPPPPGETGMAPIRIGGNIPPPKKVVHVDPQYPLAARDSEVQGLVILEVTVDATGHVSDTRVVRSTPLLDAAAVEAVRQWVFEPTLLKGRPVPVIMTVTINFAL